MKKYIVIFAGIVLGLSLGAAAAQVTGGVGACVRFDSNNICVQYQNSPTPGQPGYGQPNYQQGGPAYSQGPNTRQIGSQQADLSFFGNLIAGTGGLVRMLPPILVGAAVVVFFFFLIRYLIDGKTDPAEKKKHMKNMMYSLIAIFVMVTLWGIIAFAGDLIGINPNVQVTAPTLPR